MQVKTQKQVLALQNKVQKVADKLNKEVVVIAKGVQHIQVQAGTAYQLNTKDFDAKKSSLIANKIGNDLEVTLKESVIIFDNYFAVCATDLSCLVSLPAEDDGLYHITADASFTLKNGTKIVYLYGDQSTIFTESSAANINTNDNQSFLNVITSNVEIVAAAVVAAVVVAGSSSGNNGNDDSDDDSDDDKNTNAFFIDTGLSNSDGISNNNTITVYDLKAGETWQYSIDGGIFFVSGTDRSFTLDDGTYVANAIQIKKSDATGNPLDIIKINEVLSIIIDTEKSVFTSPTTVDVEKDTNASEIIYTATTNDDTVAYTLKGGDQKEKFTINNTTGELKYKDKQTQVGNHKVTIIATDVAGNKAEQLITVSVKIGTIKPAKPTFSFVDTGLLDNDGITNNGVIIVSGLKAGATWEYSISGDNGFTRGTGSFTLANNTTYEVNTIQIRQTDETGNVSDISKNTLRIVVDNTDPIFEQQPSTINTNINAPITTTVYDAQATNLDGGTIDEGITYSIKGTNADKFSITTDTGILTYTEKQTSVHDNDIVTIVATDLAGNKAEQLITISVKETNLSTSIVWNGIGDDNKINANEMAVTTLSGTVAIIGTVTSINISSIVFKQGDTVAHIINSNLPSVNASDNTWTLDNNNTWTSKLTQGNYTVTVNLSGNGGSVTNPSSIAIAVDIVKPSQPKFTLEDTGLLDDDGITKNGMITVSDLEIGATWQYSISDNGFVDGTGNSFTLANNTTYAANVIQVRQIDEAGNVSDISKNTLRIIVDTISPIFDQQPTTADAYINALITTTVYDTQATNSNEGTADEGITYHIKGTNIDKFSITESTGILTYKAIQTSVHNDTVTIVATDVAGNEAEQLITVSVKENLARGFVINGEDASDLSGYSVSTAGDVNGDGLDDVIIGAYGASPSNLLGAGKSYVVFGKIDNTAINLSAISSGTGGFVINGENEESWSGFSVSSAGDVNGDGLDDVIVGAHGFKLNDKIDMGKSYVIFGKIDNTAVNLSAIGTGGFVINGENTEGNNGLSVSSAGDVNGDGLDDLIIGTAFADLDKKLNVGKSYVVFGKADNTAIDLSAIGTGGFVIIGENRKDKDKSGFSVSTAGDVNGDGLDDLIIGAWGVDLVDKIAVGKSYVVFGKIDNTAINLSAISSGTGGFVIIGENAGDNSGNSVSSAGDVNGDGLDDLIVGASGANPNSKSNAGNSYVIFGKKDSIAINLSAVASGTGGFIIIGENAGGWSGNSVSSAGDVNGDGLDDLIVGAPMSDLSGKVDAGKSYVVFGKKDNTAINLSAIASGTGGFVIIGENTHHMNGFSVSTAGDVNGDGLDDLIIGSHRVDLNGKSEVGKSYVIFGKTNTNAIDLTKLNSDSKYAIDHLGNGGVDIFVGTSSDEIFVAGAGNDTLIGNGGMDVLNAGAGNDTITINASNIAALERTGTGNRARIDGGGNIDTLKLNGNDLILDLTNISNARIQDIEKINISGSGDNTLIVNLNDVLDASTSTNILKVLGNNNDTVNALGFTKASGAETEGSITYDVYTHSGANTDAEAALWIQQDVGLIIL